MNLMKIVIQRLLMVVVLLTINMSVSIASDGISLSRTRIIFLSSDKAQSVTMRNHGEKPFLVQSGVISSLNERTPAPFLTTPPLFRLEGDSKSSLRILLKPGASLPSDRESVFYFTAIAVPAMRSLTDAADQGMTARLSVGLQNTIKLFYRPAGLPVTPEEAEGRLNFEYQNGRVAVINPTPYHLTFSRLKFDRLEVNVRQGVSMVPPFSQLEYATPSSVRQAEWMLINDHGGNSKTYKAEIKRGSKA